MKKLLIILTALATLSFTLALQTAFADGASNSVSITESFDAASPTGEEVYAGENSGYTWNILATRSFGYASGSKHVDIPTANKTAVSLTANSDNNGTKNTVLTIEGGAGGADKDVDITLDAGVCAGFNQTAKTWELVFLSSEDEELFSLRFSNGDGSISASLGVGSEVQDAGYTFTDAKFTNVSARVSFEKDGGGYVTFGSAGMDFAAGGDIAAMAVRSSSNKDWNRPFVIDNFTMKTTDKKEIFFDVSSTGEGQKVKGAELTVENHTYTLGADGAFSKYFRPGSSYSYSIKLINHEPYSGSFTAYTADKYVDTYTFQNVDARRPTLIHAYYNAKSGALEELSSEEVRVDKSYTVQGERRTGSEEKFFLWNSVAGMKPYAAAQVKKGAVDNIKVSLAYHAEVTPARIVLTGGDSYIYIPGEGYTNSAPVTAEVYDNLGYPMKDVTIDWTLPGETDANIGVAGGSVTLGSGYDLTGQTHNVKIRATVRGSEVYADKQLTIRSIANISSFTVAGPAVIKNNTKAVYTVTGITDNYGNESDEVPEFTLTAYDETGAAALTAAQAEIDGLSVTPSLDLGTARKKNIKLTISLDGTDKKIQKTATVYNYDFYEPGIGVASYGDPRMETVNGAVSIVWPATETGGKTTSIPLPEPVVFTPGGCKVVTFDNFATTQAVGSQERSLRFTDSDGTDVISIDFGDKVVLNNWSSGSSYSGDIIGEFNVDTQSHAEFTFKTDTNGITFVVFKYTGNDKTIITEENLGMVNNIAELRMRGSTSAPDARLLSLTNIKIDDGELNGIEITGDDKLAIVAGADAKAQYGVKVFATEDGESFTWSVVDKNNIAIDGVTIDQNGMLTVSDSVKDLIEASSDDKIDAVIEYKGNKGSSAQKTISIVGYAKVNSFNLTGPEYLDAGTLSATYTISNITDEYGNEADMQKAYMITTGNDIASIDMQTGEVTINEGKTGTFTVTAAVGNQGKTKVIDLPVTVAKYSVTDDAEGASAAVDVTKLANYSETTKYLVTTAKADKTLVKQTEQKAVGGVVTVDLTGADKYEVSPIFSYTSVGDVGAGKTIPVCDGVYDFTFKKSDTTRADIFVNGGMVGQNVDQVSVQRTIPQGSEYTATDIKVEGGKAVVVMKDNTSAMDSITVRKVPSIVKRKTHVYVLGDSLASSYYGAFDSVDENGVPLTGTGQTGWGETLGYFLEDDMTVTNLAESGSAAAALYATTFPGIMQNAEAGDYLVMECGYQDAPNSTKETMLAAVDNMYKACREKGVELILVTPNCAAHGTANIEAISRDGGVRFGPDLMAYANDIENAKSERILGVDLSGSSTEGNEYAMMIEYGEDYWLRNFNLVRPEDGVAVDRLHSSYWGAVLHSANIATVISEAQQETDENGEPTALARRLADLHLNYDAEYTMTDTEGNNKKFKIGWHDEISHDVDQPVENQPNE